MSIYKGIYFAMLAGALAGTLAWGASTLLLVPMSDLRWIWLPDSVTLAFFGILLGALLFSSFDKIAKRKLRFRIILLDSLFGLIAALLAVFVCTLLRDPLAARSAVIYRIACWTLAVSIIAFGIGLRYAQSNWPRVIHTYAGGLVGGLLGGGFFVLFASRINTAAQLCGMILAGSATGFGAGIAPLLVRFGSVRFISSGDSRAQNKYGKNHRAWDLHPEETYVIGNMSSVSDKKHFQQGPDIYIPDASMALRHAVIFAKNGRYYIARHPDAAGTEGVSKFVLRVRGRTVVASQELSPNDDILMGKTAMRFEGRRSDEL